MEYNAQELERHPRNPLNLILMSISASRFIDRGNITSHFSRSIGRDFITTFSVEALPQDEDTYEDKGRPSAIYKGKIDLTVQTPSLIERHNEHEREAKLSKVNVSSRKDISDPNIAQAMEVQEESRQSIVGESRRSSLSSTYMDPRWKTDALADDVGGSRFPENMAQRAEISQRTLLQGYFAQARREETS